MLKNIFRLSIQSRHLSQNLTKFFSELPPREKLEYDVLIVGGGPSGLSAAIKLKQLEKQFNRTISVCLIEKGSDIGSHIISGNCFEPKGLDELFPDWRKMKNRPPVSTSVTDDRMYLLWNQNLAIPIPSITLPKELHNTGNYVISLGNLCKWLGEQAKELGVDIFPGTAGSEILYDDKGTTIGVVTGDFGIAKDGKQKQNFQRGIEIGAKQTIFAEGARGSLTEKVIQKYNLRKDSDPQIYGIGIKEIWEVQPDKFRNGLVQHTVGWPLDRKTYGGSFLYHMEPNLVHVGFVVGLQYTNPYLNPYEEFQKLKNHKIIKNVLSGGTCIGYGARVMNAGGYFSVPKLTFPGGLLVGCSAGFLNVLKIKGAHNAIKSGILAAESIYQHNIEEKGPEVKQYENAIKNSWVYEELYKSRNTKGAFKFGLYGGLLHNGATSWLTKGKEPWNLRNKVLDSKQLLKKLQVFELNYPKHDGKLTFDILENLQRSGTNHDHDQPSHLKIKQNLKESPQISLSEYDAPEERFCPAKVYEFITDDKGNKKLQINAQNCLHCKTCSIKMVDEYIDWTVPEGKGGPNYSGM